MAEQQSSRDGGAQRSQSREEATNVSNPIICRGPRALQNRLLMLQLLSFVQPLPGKLHNVNCISTESNGEGRGRATDKSSRSKKNRKLV